MHGGGDLLGAAAGSSGDSWGLLQVVWAISWGVLQVVGATSWVLLQVVGETSS